MTIIACACGQVSLETVGTPITSAICHCTSCRTAGQVLDSRSPVDPIVDASGGTAVLVWRKDRVRCVQGNNRLAAHRLSPDAPSRRIVASCCGTPMFGDWTKGFWISIYHGRVPNAPPPSMRVMTSDAPTSMIIPDDVPHFRGRPARFLIKLLTTWVVMGFRKPRIAGVADEGFLPLGLNKNGATTIVEKTVSTGDLFSPARTNAVKALSSIGWRLDPYQHGHDRRNHHPRR